MTIFYTGQGDTGKSAMGTKKISKADPLMEALGCLDELNSWIGLVRSGYKLQATRLPDGQVSYKLKAVQEDLFIAQSELGMKSSKYKVSSIKTKKLEEEIAKIDEQVPNIKHFIVPGASELSAKIDYARALARRAERACVVIKASPELLQYLNRLSAYLFALARMVNYRLKIKEERPGYK